MVLLAIVLYQLILFITVSYSESRVLPLFAHANSLSHPFGTVHRIKLLLSMIHVDAGVNLEELIHHEEVSAFFPLKDETVASEINDKWLNLKVMPWQMPIDEVSNHHIFFPLSLFLLI
jgi:hypothetical protein